MECHYNLVHTFHKHCPVLWPWTAEIAFILVKDESRLVEVDFTGLVYEMYALIVSSLQAALWF